jgi:hypothetical protein
MMPARRRPVALVLGVAFVVAVMWSPVPASGDTAPTAPATALTCDQSVTTDVVLSHDLDCPGGLHLDLDTPGVTLDLAGHTIRSGVEEPCDVNAPPEFIDCALEITADGVTVKNGRLVDVGLFLMASADVQRMKLSSSTAYLAGGRFHDNVANDSAVLLLGISGSPEVTRNWFSRTPLRLDNIQFGVPDVRITRNIIDRSPSHGIELPVADVGFFPDDVGGVVAHNLIVRSAVDGINVNGALIYLGPLALEHNTVLGSGGHGISIVGDLEGQVLLDDWVTVTGGPVTVKANGAHLNGGHGILADTGEEPVVDGGGNRAFFNRLRPACVGVVCQPWRWW